VFTFGRLYYDLHTIRQAEGWYYNIGILPNRTALPLSVAQYRKNHCELIRQREKYIGHNDEPAQFGRLGAGRAAHDASRTLRTGFQRAASASPEGGLLSLPHYKRLNKNHRYHFSRKNNQRKLTKKKPIKLVEIKVPTPRRIRYRSSKSGNGWFEDGDVVEKDQESSPKFESDKALLFSLVAPESGKN
jgi:hypothetical protein